MYKIGAIGDAGSIIGFMSVGFSVRIADTPDEAETALKAMAKDEFAIIYITEKLAREIAETIEKYKDKPFPAVIVIPDKDGSIGYGMSNLRSSAERAIGADILFKDN